MEKKSCFLDKPKKNNKIIDVASGTGDIAKLCSESTHNSCEIVCVEPNEKMLQQGKNKLRNFNNIRWKMSSAEYLPFEDETFDYYTISFGIRNVSNFDKSLINPSETSIEVLANFNK